MDMVDSIIAYETGEMSESEMVRFFSDLIKQNMTSKLQGHYGRTASRLVEAGVLNNNGDILVDLKD
jgi:hypothetical protein